MFAHPRWREPTWGTAVRVTRDCGRFEVLDYGEAHAPTVLKDFQLQWKV